MFSYGRTKQFREIIATFNHYISENPGLIDREYAFIGTPKINGTNRCITYNGKEFQLWNKNRVFCKLSDDYECTEEADRSVNSFRFREFIDERRRFLEGMKKHYHKSGMKGTLAVYGEFAGRGIMKGTAANLLDMRIFCIFEARNYMDDGRYYVIPAEDIPGSFEDLDIYNLPRDYSIRIAARIHTEEGRSFLIGELERLIRETSSICPFFRKAFGMEGTGEGYVFVIEGENDRLYEPGRRIVRFKIKNEEHKISRTRRTVETDPAEIGKLNDFIAYAVTENRLEQGLNVMKEEGLALSQENTGRFIKWVVGDIHREEKDVIEKNSIDIKAFNKKVSKIIAEYYLKTVFPIDLKK